MEWVAVLLLLGVAAVVRGADQQRRVVRLGEALARFRIEKHMALLTDGYLRALGEIDAERAAAVWGTFRPAELALKEEFAQLAADLARQPADAFRVTRLPIDLPLSTRWLATATFDLRALMDVHARGIGRAVDRLAIALSDDARREAAYAMVSEMLLLQHSCHWYCKSRNVASARLLARHRTAYDQVLGGVADATRRDYLAVVQGA